MILDPFTGSGTTNLEASLLGRHSIGVDVDPFSRFIASVKTTVLPYNDLFLSWHSLRPRVESYSEPSHLDGVPEFPYRDNWFRPYILKELAHIKTEIEKTDASPRVKDFFLVCFSSVIRQVSEADNNCTRTVVRKRLEKRCGRTWQSTCLSSERRPKWRIWGRCLHKTRRGMSLSQTTPTRDQCQLSGMEV